MIPIIKIEGFLFLSYSSSKNRYSIPIFNPKETPLSSKFLSSGLPPGGSGDNLIFIKGKKFIIRCCAIAFENSAPVLNEKPLNDIPSLKGLNLAKAYFSINIQSLPGLKA